jgi:hypothetical protein
MSNRIVHCVWATLLAAGSTNGVLAAEPQDNGASDTAKAKAATELARAQLASELQFDVATIEALTTEARTWPDSSLGCGKPGTMAAQVLTNGYEVMLKTTHGNYRVHVADKNAVVCGSATQWRNQRNVGLPLKELNGKIEIARADLAAKLNAPQNQISTMTFVATDWPDSSMDCAVASEQVVKKFTKGYRIALNYSGRIYTYHTDMDRVRACPAIEAE